MTDFVNRYTQELVRFVVGLSVVIRAFEDRYSKLGAAFLRLYLACSHKTSASMHIR